MGVTDMLFLMSVCVLATLAHAQLKVNTTQGVVVGYQARDAGYYTFYGIRYGGSTAGENRFKPPTPAPQYPDEYHANHSIICAQPSDHGIIGQEDCLVLNVFTNTLNISKPVLVVIANEEGYNVDSIIDYLDILGHIGAAPLFSSVLEQDMVVVRLNYRLSIFGFLCLGVTEAPGNAGLKDIVQGLKWINQNIAAFGGDPNNVALFGYGTGAAMVDLVTMSPLATGLVHKAITLSGSALAPWAVAYDPIGYAKVFGEKLGFTGKNTTELAKLLAGTAINIMANALNESQFANISLLFAPCIENPTLNDRFLTEAPIYLLRSGKYNQIPYMTGYDSGGFLLNQTFHGLQRKQMNFTDFLPVDMELGVNRSGVETSIKECYLAHQAKNFDTIAYESDIWSVVPVVRGAKERALTSNSSVRLVEFDSATDNNTEPYNTTTISNKPISGSWATSLLGMIAGLAKTGTPNVTVSWEPVTSSRFNYLWYGIISEENHREEIRVNPHQQKTAFWNDIYSKYYIPPSVASPVMSPVVVAGAERLIGTILVFLGCAFVAFF